MMHMKQAEAVRSVTRTSDVERGNAHEGDMLESLPTTFIISMVGKMVNRPTK